MSKLSCLLSRIHYTCINSVFTNWRYGIYLLYLIRKLYKSIKTLNCKVAQIRTKWICYKSTKTFCIVYFSNFEKGAAAAAAAKSLQSCPTLCDPIDESPPGSPVPGIFQARVLEWVAISFSNAWKWKVKVKPPSRVRLLATPWTAAYQAPPFIRKVNVHELCIKDVWFFYSISEICDLYYPNYSPKLHSDCQNIFLISFLF